MEFGRVSKTSAVDGEIEEAGDRVADFTILEYGARNGMHGSSQSAWIG